MQKIRREICETKKLGESEAVSKVKHRRSNSVASLQRAHINKLFIYVPMRKHKAPIYKLSRSKASKYGKFRLTDIRENPEDF